MGKKESGVWIKEGNQTMGQSKAQKRGKKNAHIKKKKSALGLGLGGQG